MIWSLTSRRSNGARCTTSAGVEQKRSLNASLSFLDLVATLLLLLSLILLVVVAVFNVFLDILNAALIVVISRSSIEYDHMPYASTRSLVIAWMDINNLRRALSLFNIYAHLQLLVKYSCQPNFFL
jgi:hypothetical protein